MYETTKDHKQPKQSWERKTKAGRMTLSDFKSYYKAVVIKMMWYWHKDRYADQWKRVRKCENKPMHIHPKYFWQGWKKIHSGETLSTNEVGKTG